MTEYSIDAECIQGDDIDSIDEFSVLHKAVFEAQGDSSWTPKSVKELVCSPGVSACLYKIDGVFAGLSMVRSVCDESELLTIAVAEKYQSKSVGQKILTHLVGILKTQNIVSFFLEVREDNVKAVQLYLKNGFEKAGKRRNYYHIEGDKRVDALLFTLKLDQ